jgi:hypothetical protein
MNCRQNYSKREGANIIGTAVSYEGNLRGGGNARGLEGQYYLPHLQEGR